MHRVIAGQMRSFSESYLLQELPESDQFEMMINHCSITPELVEEYDLSDVTTGSGDDGIDGCALIIDEEVVLSPEDGEAQLSDGRRQHNAKLVLTQAKTGETIDLGNMLKFHAAVERFCLDFNDEPCDEIERTTKETFAKTLDHAGALRNGKPELKLRYAYTGRYLRPAEAEKAIEQLVRRIDEAGYFSKIDYVVMDRDQINAAYNSTTAPVEAKISAFSIAPLPAISGVEESYLAVVPAKQIVDHLLADTEGRLRGHVFEENVRAFLGTDNPVNSAIGATIEDQKDKTRFPVLNNGITVVSPDIRVQGLNITFLDFQIVNGCQTSNMLWEKRDQLDNSMMVTIKVIETTNEDMFSDLVKATNSQTKIDDDQFLSLQPIARTIERYFASFDESENKLYFERRDRQYVGQNIPGLKTFDLKLLARCVSAVFIQRPDLSFKFPRKIFSDLEISKRVFSADNKEIIYYTACLVFYRIAMLFSNRQLPNEARRLKWLMMALFVRKVNGPNIPPIRSAAIVQYCQNIIDLINENHQECKDKLLECFADIQALGEITSDRLKRQAVFEELISK